MKDAVMRVARACADLDAMARQYADGLGFEVLSQWHDHDGFDGAILGHASAPYHLEFIHVRDGALPPPPHHEHLLVFFVPDADEWQMRCDAMSKAGFEVVEPANPYWERNGRTFRDREGGHVILQNEAWLR